MIPVNANNLKNSIIEQLAYGSQWEERPVVDVVSYGTVGDVWTVTVTGDVNVSKLSARLQERATAVTNEGFARCVETYVVVFADGEIDTIECQEIRFSSLEEVQCIPLELVAA
jgi:hypothetical protein